MKVLLLPDTAVAGSVAGLLERWSALGLLRPLAVWLAEEGATPTVRLLDGDRVEEMPLPTALADSDRDEIEFLAVLPQLAGEELDPGFREILRRFLDRVRRGVLAPDEDRALGCALAVAPENAEQRFSPEIFSPEWANLLIAPEDRASPEGVNQLGLGAEDFARHVAHAAATIGALWATPDPGRPDLLGRLRDQPAEAVRVPVATVRCFSRVVETGFLVDHVAATAFESRGGWPRPGPEFESAPDPERLLRRVAGAYLEEHSETLVRRSFKELREVPHPPRDIFTALRVLIGQVIGYVMRLPSQLLEEAVASVHDSAARYIEALSETTGRIVVRRWYEERESADDLDPLEKALGSEPLVIEDGTVEQTWTDLRQTALGLVDGSRLPEAIDPQLRAPAERRYVVSEPELVAPDPAASGGAAEDEEEAGAEGGISFLEQVRARVEESLESAADRLEALEARLGERLGAQDEEEGRPPRRGGAWLRRTVGRIAATAILAVIAVAAAIVMLPPLAALAACLAIVALLVLVAGFAARRALARPLIPYDEQAAAELRRLNEIVERAQLRGDVERLRRRLDELDAWIEILGELLHRPWVREPFEGMEVGETIDDDDLPAACGVAVAEGDSDLVARLGAGARGEAFGPGWLSAIYRAVQVLVLAEWPEEERPIRDATADTRRGEASLRLALLDAVRRGDGRSRFDNPVAAKLLKTIDAARLDAIAPVVRPASPGVRPLGPTATWIAPPAGIEAVEAACAGRAVAVRGWKAAGVALGADLVLTAAAAVVDRLMFVAPPGVAPQEVVEIVRPEGTGLALLRLGSPCCEAVGVAASPPCAGAAVVAVEATQEGSVARWGYVTAGDRLTIVFDGGPPRLGAPIFDRDGNLLAVQGERDRPLPVPSLEDLTELPGEASRPAGVVARRGARREPGSASEFLGSIVGPGGGIMVRDYWSAWPAPNRIELALPAGSVPLGEAGAVGRLSGGVQFLRPLRIMLHRIEVTQPAEPAELAFCAPAGDDRARAGEAPAAW